MKIISTAILNIQSFETPNPLQVISLKTSNPNPALPHRCCGLFFLNTQFQIPYLPSQKKEVLITSLPISIQAKLLRVIQEREIERLGSHKLLRLNIRLIAATNSDLKQLADHGRFRDDLLFRLSKAVLRLPPLRDRPEDIPVYIHSFLKILQKSIQVNPQKAYKESLDFLMGYDWPGNVRELINVLEQSFLKAGSAEEILPSHLPDELHLKNPPSNASLLERGAPKQQMQELEKSIISRTLHFFNGNKRKIAQHLGLQRSVLYVIIKKCGLSNNGSQEV